MEVFRYELANTPYINDPELKAIFKNRWAFTNRQSNATRTKIATRLYKLGVSEDDMRKMFPDTLSAPPVKPPAEPTATEVGMASDAPATPSDAKFRDDSNPAEMETPSIFETIFNEYPSSKSLKSPNERLLNKSYKIMKNPKRYGVKISDQTSFVDIYDALYNHEKELRRSKYEFLNKSIHKKSVDEQPKPVENPPSAAPQMPSQPVRPPPPMYRKLSFR